MEEVQLIIFEVTFQIVEINLLNESLTNLVKSSYYQFIFEEIILKSFELFISL